jgi:hypothetical protein
VTGEKGLDVSMWECGVQNSANDLQGLEGWRFSTYVMRFSLGKALVRLTVARTVRIEVGTSILMIRWVIIVGVEY